MAKYRRGKKLEPAVMTMTFPTPDTVGGEYTIDLSQAASLLNRRFYRQGINWVVDSFKLYSAAAGAVAISKIPTTWTFFNAYKKGFETWQQMNNEALAESESVRPRFLDFKIFADDVHHSAGYIANLLPTDSQANIAGAGEWQPSSIHVPFGPASAGNTTELKIKAVGANYNGGTVGVVSLIDGYAASRGLPYQNDPNTPGDADDASGSTPENWMSALHNSGTDQDTQVLQDMILENNKAPYPFEGDGTAVDTQYPGGANQLPALERHDIVQLFASSANQVGTRMAKGGIFPCGLVRISWAPESAANLVIQVNMVPGEHRGYMCEPTLEA